MNIVFMGTPEFAVPTLEALYSKGHNISLVVTQKDKQRGRGKKVLPTPVKKRALELGLEVYQPDSVNQEESIGKLREICPDAIIVVAFGQILKKEVLNIPKYGCLNVHASILPKYRGAAPINWAIINGEKETGITIMEMDEGLDTGDILKIERIPIEREDDSITIHDKLSSLGGKLIVEVLEDIEKGDINKIPQNDKFSCYAPMLSKKTGRIDWDNNGDNIINLIRGLKPWPSAYFVYNGDNIKIHKAKKAERFPGNDNGVVTKVTDEGIYVNCQDSSIVIEELQFPGRNKMKVSEYLRGNQFPTNLKLS